MIEWRSLVFDGDRNQRKIAGCQFQSEQNDHDKAHRKHQSAGDTPAGLRCRQDRQRGGITEKSACQKAADQQLLDRQTGFLGTRLQHVFDNFFRFHVRHGIDSFRK